MTGRVPAASVLRVRWRRGPLVSRPLASGSFRRPPRGCRRRADDFRDTAGSQAVAAALRPLRSVTKITTRELSVLSVLRATRRLTVLGALAGAAVLLLGGPA